MIGEQKLLLTDVIWVDPDRLSGAPCFKGTRVPVQSLIDSIQANATLDDFFNDFPSVTREQVSAFLDLARDRLIAECASS